MTIRVGSFGTMPPLRGSGILISTHPHSWGSRRRLHSAAPTGLKTSPRGRLQKRGGAGARCSDQPPLSAIAMQHLDLRPRVAGPDSERQWQYGADKVRALIRLGPIGGDQAFAPASVELERPGRA